MIARLYHYSFYIPFCLFLIHQLLQKALKISFVPIDYYLDPLCLAPLVLHAVSIERAYFFNQKKLSVLDIIMITIVLATVSEFVFPYLSDQFHQDWVDFLMIFGGSIWFLVTRNKVYKNYSPSL